MVEALSSADIALRFVGIGSCVAAKRFAEVSGLPLDLMRVDGSGAAHAALGLHAGPDWDVPQFVLERLSEEDGARARAWLNYMAMCSGISARGTVREIARGYFGDRSAPERLRAEAVVRAGSLVEINGTRRVRLSPFGGPPLQIAYDQAWSEERGYQRPLELATVRLRHMVEVLSKWSTYVSDESHLAQRGATFLLDAQGATLYQHRDSGVLTFSATMPRPLSFLEPYIGAQAALNPLGLGDNAQLANKLLPDGANTVDDAVDESGETRLIQAAERGDAAACRALLHSGADVNTRSSSGWTALHGACEHGDLECVRLLLRAGADRAATTHTTGKSPFDIARQYGHPRVADQVQPTTKDDAQ